MVPSNAARRHVRERAAGTSTVGTSKCRDTPLPGSQGYGDRGDLLRVSLTSMVQLDGNYRSYNRGAQGGGQKRQDPRSDEDKTHCEGGHIGVVVRNEGT